MKRLLIVLLVLLSACHLPTKIVTTYQTDSTTGKSKKVVTKYYDTVRVVHERYYNPYWYHYYSPNLWWNTPPYYRWRYHYIERQAPKAPAPPPRNNRVVRTPRF